MKGLNKKLAKSIALGLLMATPCSVWAADLTVDTINNDISGVDTLYVNGKDGSGYTGIAENVTVSVVNVGSKEHNFFHSDMSGKLYATGDIHSTIINGQSNAEIKANNIYLYKKADGSIGSLTLRNQKEGSAVIQGTISGEGNISVFGGNLEAGSINVTGSLGVHQNGVAKVNGNVVADAGINIDQGKLNIGGDAKTNGKLYAGKNTNVTINGNAVADKFFASIGSNVTMNSIEGVAGKALSDFANHGTTVIKNGIVSAYNFNNNGNLKQDAAGDNTMQQINVTNEFWNSSQLKVNDFNMTSGTIHNSGQLEVDKIGSESGAVKVNNSKNSETGAVGNLTVAGDVYSSNLSNEGQFHIKGNLVVDYLQEYDTSAHLQVDKNLTIGGGNSFSDIRGDLTVGETFTVQESVSFGNADGNQHDKQKLSAKKIVIDSPNGWLRLYDRVEDMSVESVEIHDGSWLQAATNDKIDIGKLDITGNGKLTTWNPDYDKETGVAGTTSINVAETKIAENSKLTIYEQTKGGSSISLGSMTLESNAVLQNGGQDEKEKYKPFVGDKALSIDSVNTGSGTGATIKNQGDIIIGKTEGNELTIRNEKLDDKVTIGNNAVDNINVVGNSKITDSFGDDVQSGMQALADTVIINGGNEEKNITAEAGKIYGDIIGKTDSNGKVVITDSFVNQYNQGISEMAAISLMTWRQENDDMNKRLGELRNSNGEHGIWTRMTRGESKYGNQSIKNQYNSYQIGYDEKLSTNKAWTVGAALTYTDGESSFNKGSGENTHKGMAVYGSYLGEDGSFVDIIAKYARLEHEFDVAGGAGKGDYDTNGYSISAEYGKRFEKGNGFWIEPQVELTYGKVASASYVTNEGVHVNQDGMESLVGRVGFSLGKDIKQGNVYVRASYLYDFDGETNANYSYKGVNRNFEQDLGGGWFEVGVGTNYNLSDATYLYLDVEKTYGGDVATPWQWNAGIRYSF